ncbi:MAG: aspartate/glutamate racemase family protein [Bacillota bacterium]
MKVGVIHATTTAVEPIEKAFREVFPQAKLLHFMDTGLLPMIQEAKGLSPEIINRFTLLVNLASQSKVDCIQLTCSAFNNVTEILQPLYSKKLFRSDEAMLDQVLAYNHIGLISTVEETPPALLSYLRQKNPHIKVESLVNTQAIDLLFKGKIAEHDQLVSEMMSQLEGTVEAIVLSQYSMAHMTEKLNCSIPVLTGPKASAERIRDYLAK